MSYKLTKFELRKIITERRLLLEEESDDNTFNGRIGNDETKELRFRQWVNSTSYKAKFHAWLQSKDKYEDKKLDPFIPRGKGEDMGPGNKYVKGAWNYKIESEDNKTIGQLYIEQVLEKDTSNDQIAKGAKDLNTMKDFEWDDIVPRVKALCTRGDQLGAEVLLLLYSKWNCSRVEGEKVITDTTKWNKVKDQIGEYLKYGIAAEKQYKNTKEKPADSKAESKKLKTDSKTPKSVDVLNNAGETDLPGEGDTSEVI